MSMESNQLFGHDTMNAPWGLESRTKLVALACHFFNAKNIAANHSVINKEVPSGRNPEPLTVSDFHKCLEVNKTFPKAPNAFRVVQIVEQMSSTGLLVHAGHGNRSVAGLQDHYLYFLTASEARRDLFRLVPVLGPEYLYKLCASGLVHITGTNGDGKTVAGTGLIVDSSHILTCRHVVSDMIVDEKQVFQGNEYIVNKASVHVHPEVDVAVVRMNGPLLSPLKGALFKVPVVAQTVYTLGYPKLPGLRDASVTMQQGAVTNASVTSLSGEKLFLYSAISRPGNSGGPVMSEDGYVVGLSIVDATGQYDPSDAFSPHYAGIPAQVVVGAVEDLGLGIQLPYLNLE
ncbi:MAG: trypsin-like peptidase domain-containing protein [Chloroflexi bacterium]|nr:trypsin-like peptidase domain-containing protein [Chloroflexota bacterium]